MESYIMLGHDLPHQEEPATAAQLCIGEIARVPEALRRQASI